MSDIAESDIFFMITSASVVLVTIAILIVTYFVVKALREARLFMELLRKEITTSGSTKNMILLQTLFVQRYIRYFARNIIQKVLGKY